MKFLTAIAFDPRPTLSDRLRAALETHKVVHLHSVPSSTDLDTLYQELARSLGDFLYKNENPVTAELESDGWMDMRYDAALADAQPYRHGNGRMPLHMDGVYTDVHFDIIFLFCTAAAKWGGATTFVDGSEVVRFLADFDPQLLRDLRSTPIRFSKGNKSKTMPIVFDQQGQPAFNWNIPRLDPGNATRAIAIAKRFHAFCETYLADGGVVTDLKLRQGEAVFFHNRLLLHGRNSFHGDRCLLKGAVVLPTTGALAARHAAVQTHSVDS